MWNAKGVTLEHALDVPSSSLTHLALVVFCNGCYKVERWSWLSTCAQATPSACMQLCRAQMNNPPFSARALPRIADAVAVSVFRDRKR